MEKIILSLVVLNCLTNILLAIAMIFNARDIAKLEARLLFPELYKKAEGSNKEGSKAYNDRRYS